MNYPKSKNIEKKENFTIKLNLTNIMTKEERIQLILIYAKKVVQYPKGSGGYDPVDMANLEYAIEKYEQIKN